ncbi:DUF4760 domain-containing protein [Idiomarina abyssalis]|uniref:DUF4760 domain-containing protein n=1 Tax=Idiomarina abyssalis TaxID=86102 RepID=UPI003A945237
MKPWVSGILAGIGVTTLTISLIPGLLSISSDNSNAWLHLIQAVSYVLTSIGSVCLIESYLKNKVPDTKSFSAIIAWVTIFLLVISYIVLRYFETYQIALSILMSMTIVVMGWWVQSVLSAKSSRKQHTLNTILDTRSSAIYQQHLERYSRLIKDYQHIHPKIAEWFHYPNKDDFSQMAVPKELKDAINGLAYVMNYFEFLALAIKQGDLDETLLKECFCGMLPKIESRAFHLIREAQSKDSRFFEAFVSLTQRWSQENRSLILEHKSNPSDAEIGEPFPSEEQVKEILEGKEVNLGYKCYDS